MMSRSFKEKSAPCTSVSALGVCLFIDINVTAHLDMCKGHLDELSRLFMTLYHRLVIHVFCEIYLSIELFVLCLHSSVDNLIKIPSSDPPVSIL